MYCLGRGAYFSDNPEKAHQYTGPENSDQLRVMFYSKVILGNESIQYHTNTNLISAPKNCHSVRGTVRPVTKYIIYRYAQALPYLKITYKL